MRITMVGTGYVGLVTGTCFANLGNEVTCLDVDPVKIDKLKAGISPIYEPGLDEMIARNVKAGRLHFTVDKAAAYASAEIIFLCVGTPSDARGHADLKYVLAASGDIGDAIEAAGGETGGDPGERRAKIIVVKSTVPVGTNAKVREAIAAKTGKPFRMASNPEFLKEGAAITDFMKPDRVVVGVDDEHGTGGRMRDLYEPFVRNGHPIYVMDIPSAEMVKYAANAMLATKISFINEIAALCEAYGSNVDEVWRGMTSDARIGNKFLYPGLGYGGSCFPKDTLACVSMGSESATPTPLLQAVHDVNQRQREDFFAKIVKHFGGESNLRGKAFGVWGLAFKPGTDDVREAPAVTLIEKLLAAGATVKAHDPVAHETARELLGDRITYCDRPMDTARDADALLICTDWPEFKQPPLERLRETLAAPVIFDGRNLYKPAVMEEAGFTYVSVGRRAVNAPAAG
ncbi:UDP-glucose dehydrogenase family protein [Phycisphaera mikurensis]|uniref:UDP-glucose 6-dehydrogenase n=1 Tax=Phycisphaera mikurensis (strain NBRC 102666 / KCTC 22515 / FYK2301M01) TaxID=1142394 RepID=I0IAL6_PHYMF|nr:UDP-glucose/GDP-mannose dehydrogenase family protein [Phycisphaera mikurensis]MBB6441700.1 UDPglucose 6-dehydrogenase [Phycisphaera mikurensis]BAM02304.1 UDP-glucose 6-dehydrogenase [Phycisphaera mikurensis NBRC 102666]